MSNVDTATNAATNANPNPVANAPVLNDEQKEQVGTFIEKIAKRGKLVIAPSDQDTNVLEGVILNLGEVKDWTQKAPAGFDTVGLAKAAKSGEVRMIAIANIDLALANETVRRALYRVYQSRVIGAAADEEAEEAQFITVDGCFKVKYDPVAFKELAPKFMKVIRSKGFSINTAMFKAALESTQFANGAFPKIKPEQWQSILRIMKDHAVKANHDVSLFEHWEKTRDAKEDRSETPAFDWEKDLAEAEAEDDNKAAPSTGENAWPLKP